MKHSTLNSTYTQRDAIDTFGGYNHNLKINDSEFFDMKNMTSDFFPTLSPRKKRGVYPFPESLVPVTHKINGMISKDALCYVDGTDFYIDNHRTEGFTLTDSPKQLLSMGAYVIVLPDKKYINTLDTTDKGDIEASYTSLSGSTVSYSMCKMDGTEYTNTVISSEPPENPENTTLWIDTSNTPHTLKQYSATNSTWSPIATTYIKISANGIAADFKQFDAVKISGIDGDLTQLQDLEGKISPIWDIYHDSETPANDYIVVVGMIDEMATQTTSITVLRKMPLMDFVIESNNRLWGCRYGTNIDGQVVNEIYASKQGDFKNWNCFMGISTDSYAASCGTDGAWTGAVSHLGYPLFFKENCFHKVYGNFPSNYQIQTTPCRGVQKGCGNSLAIVNELLFYKSRTGVCVYDGSLPTEISYAFGDDLYTGVDGTDTDLLRNGAVASAHRNKYYLSAKSENDGKWYLLVYDTASKLWHKEDELRVSGFCSSRGELYYYNKVENKIKVITNGANTEEGAIDWMVETGVIGASLIDNKYVSKINIRMALDTGTTVFCYIQYDSAGEWKMLHAMTGHNLRSFTIPLRPKRCDHFRLRIVGSGDAKIYSISKTLEQGSDY